MKIKMKAVLSVSVLLLSAAVMNAEAKVSQAEADRLGNDLTRMGGNPKANADGTIPAFTGDTLGVPKGVTYKGTGTFYPNPYPNEKPLFIIDGKNWEKYKSNLSDGEIALFKKYSATFKMPIYPTKRDVRYPDRTYENVKRNAVTAEIVGSGNGVKYSFGGPPFAIPQNGVEAIWNHEHSPNPVFTEGVVASAAVFNNGSISMRKQMESRYFALFDPEQSYEKFDGVTARVMVEATDPPREKGKVTLVHEFMDLTEMPRNAWQYLPGTRRLPSRMISLMGLVDCVPWMMLWHLSAQPIVTTGKLREHARFSFPITVMKWMTQNILIKTSQQSIILILILCVMNYTVSG